MSRLISTHLIAFLACLALVNAAVVHTHGSHSLHKEREEDGAYSPRDKNHIASDEHNAEFDHEAILGSVKTAEEFDHLTKDESIRRLRILLVQMDLNGDGAIDKRELKAWIMRSFKLLSEEEAKERQEDADENEDGKITWEEYITDTYGSDEGDDTLPSYNEQLIADDKVMWDVADTNKDNILEGEEWMAFSHPEENPRMLPTILAQTLKGKDLNHDNAIDFQEYIGERGTEHDKEWLLVEKHKFDHELDSDGDGKLMGAEILSWVVPSNEEIAGEEVDHLFETSDDDQDGILSFDEVVAHHDTFVGSEATDYGDHIHNIHQFTDEL